MASCILVANHELACSTCSASARPPACQFRCMARAGSWRYLSPARSDEVRDVLRRPRQRRLRGPQAGERGGSADGEILGIFPPGGTCLPVPAAAVPARGAARLALATGTPAWSRSGPGQDQSMRPATPAQSRPAKLSDPRGDALRGGERAPHRILGRARLTRRSRRRSPSSGSPRRAPPRLINWHEPTSATRLCILIGLRRLRRLGSCTGLWLLQRRTRGRQRVVDAALGAEPDRPRRSTPCWGRARSQHRILIAVHRRPGEAPAASPTSSSAGSAGEIPATGSPPPLAGAWAGAAHLRDLLPGPGGRRGAAVRSDPARRLQPDRGHRARRVGRRGALGRRSRTRVRRRRPAPPLQGRPRQQGQDDARGLWRYSRHPNYFFQWLTWVAYALVALAAPYGWIGFLAPAPHPLPDPLRDRHPARGEQALKSRGEDYRRYQRETSPFVPWFPRSAGIAERVVEAGVPTRLLRLGIRANPSPRGCGASGGRAPARRPRSSRARRSAGRRPAGEAERAALRGAGRVLRGSSSGRG